MVGLPVQTFQEKQTALYLLKIPDDESDLHIQIYFTQPFAQLVASKKIFKIVRLIETGIREADLEGSYEIEVIPEAQSVYLGSPGFWKSFVTDISAVLMLVEGVLLSELM